MTDEPSTASDPAGDAGRTVVLGVTGCIAAYKAAGLVRRLQRRGWRVKVVMTRHATEFITPLTLRTLSGEPVAVELLVQEAEGPLPHLSLADEADVFLVAPATANVLAKLAGGVADDLLTTAALATRAPLVVAPAMNTKMWAAEATRANARTLQERGVVLVGPGGGALACGEEGEGRLARLDDILEAVAFEMDRRRALEGRRVVVTAGGTQEPLDPVRFLGNRSSGRMGYALADEARRMGAEVVLVSAPTSLPPPYGVTVVGVRTALQMCDAVRAELGADGGGADALVMAAAVADYRPVDVSEAKLKKGAESMTVELARNPDILAEIGEDRRVGRTGGPSILVGFAAESLAADALVAEARSKLEAKGLDLVVGNDITQASTGFDAAENHCAVIDGDGKVEWVGPAPKPAVARRILELVARALSDRPRAGGGTGRSAT